MRSRPIAAVLLSVLAAPAQERIPEQTFRTTVNIVVVPVTVMDRDGNHVSGLEAHNFQLFDNEKPQDIRMDVSFVPISLVVAVQADAVVEAVLPQVRKIGPLLEGLVIGQQGEAAVLSFDHRLQLMQDFTSDGRLLTQALEKIKPGSSTSRLTDSVFEAARMLRRRPQNHRRVILIISETRDKGSEGRLREALVEVQHQNILVYTLDISRVVTTLTSKTPAPRPDHVPPAARPLPPGAPATPTTAAQMGGGQGQSASFIPVFVEVFRQVKAIFVSNPLEVLTRFTGGREYSFLTQRQIESAVSRIGEELHSQYLLSYNPNNKLEGGWHNIRVVVNKPEMKITTRPGYWLAAVPD